MLRSSRLPAILLLAGAIGLAGCGSSGKSTAAKPKSTAPTTVPSQVANDTNLRNDVAIGSCASVPGGWGAVGTVHNSGTTARTYTITIFFTNSGATDEGSAITKVSVDPGKTATWKADATIASPDPNTMCVKRGVG